MNIILKYFLCVCFSFTFFSFIHAQSIDKIESIDMGRKGIHNEGARVIVERFEGRIKTNQDTARRIFTLIYVLTYATHSFGNFDEMIENDYGVQFIILGWGKKWEGYMGKLKMIHDKI